MERKGRVLWEKSHPFIHSFTVSTVCICVSYLPCLYSHQFQSTNLRIHYSITYYSKGLLWEERACSDWEFFRICSLSVLLHEVGMSTFLCATFFFSVSYFFSRRVPFFSSALSWPGLGYGSIESLGRMARMCSNLSLLHFPFSFYIQFHSH